MKAKFLAIAQEAINDALEGLAFQTLEQFEPCPFEPGDWIAGTVSFSLVEPVQIGLFFSPDHLRTLAEILFQDSPNRSELQDLCNELVNTVAGRVHAHLAPDSPP